MPIEAVETEDGSWTLYDSDQGVHYRSMQGALGESRHVFLEGTGLLQRPTPWCVLELGLGGGLNFLHTADLCWQQKEGLLDYHAVECAPVDPALFQEPGMFGWLQHQPLLGLLLDALTKARTQLAQSPPQHQPVTASLEEGKRRVTLTLYPSLWQETQLLPFQAHAAFHDPFGPRDNPEGWTEACFAWVKANMHPEGRLATYGAAGHARRAMQAAGWHVTKRPGHGRKRDMTLAALDPEKLL